MKVLHPYLSERTQLCDQSIHIVFVSVYIQKYCVQFIDPHDVSDILRILFMNKHFGVLSLAQWQEDLFFVVREPYTVIIGQNI